MNVRSRIALVIALALILVPPPSVQGQGTYLGVRGGISVTDYSLPNLSEDWRSGFLVGGFLAIPLASHASLQPEVSWVRKGADWFREGVGPTRADLDYATLGVLVRPSLSLGRGVSLSGLVGPWVGVLSKCGTADDEPEDCESVFGNDDHRSIDFGWDLGLGVTFRTGLFATQLDLRQSRGVSRVLKHRAEDNPTTEGTQLSIGLGYQISRD